MIVQISFIQSPSSISIIWSDNKYEGKKFSKKNLLPSYGTSIKFYIRENNSEIVVYKKCWLGFYSLSHFLLPPGIPLPLIKINYIKVCSATEFPFFYGTVSILCNKVLIIDSWCRKRKKKGRRGEERGKKRSWVQNQHWIRARHFYYIVTLAFNTVQNSCHSWFLIQFIFLCSFVNFFLSFLVSFFFFFCERSQLLLSSGKIRLAGIIFLCFSWIVVFFSSRVNSSQSDIECEENPLFTWCGFFFCSVFSAIIAG